MMRTLWIAVAFLVAGATSALAQSYDPKPWLADLDELHDAFGARYANFEWAVFDREVDMGALFADARKRVETAGSDADARAAFDRLIRRLGDGHVELHWPAHGAHDVGPAPPCADYDAVRAAKPLAGYAKGYAAIETPRSDLIPIGVIASGKRRVGVLKIPSFTPSAFPQLCRAAVAALAIPADKPCDDACSDRIEDWTEARLNEGFIAQLQRLKQARIDSLLIDVAGNGGGTEWAEAAARMVTARRLTSDRRQFMRGPHWAQAFAKLETELRAAAKDAAPKDRALLQSIADQAAAKRKVAETPCDAGPLWQGKHPDCAWLGEGFYFTGPLASADPTTLRGKPWAARVFSPMEFQYTEGLWRGPLIVLVDAGSASASEEFAGLLQDNHAALIMGETTAGAGCGHTDGGTPTTLSHSKAVFIVPDCATPRADGGNASRGVLPDVLVGFRRTDGPHLRAQAFLRKLPEALAKAGRR